MDPEIFEYRGYVVQALPRSELTPTKAKAQKYFNQTYGKGWELEGAIPGSVLIPQLQGQDKEQKQEPKKEQNVESIILIFKREKTHPVTGVSLGGA
ncbi:MAG: hypothetical protein ACREI3_04890 [Nitrospirales bacterium]